MVATVYEQVKKIKIAWQSVDGIVLLDKALGVSSHQALQQVRRVYRAAKAGHTGTLDPLATGLLPLCLGEASKFAQGLLDADKTYVARLCLGVTTTTGDAEGTRLESKRVGFNQANLDAVIARFTGEIEQVPPMYSALKYQGRPLYELARQGIDIERAPRCVNIYHLKVVETSFENAVACEAGQAWVDIEAKVSKGTYIRTLGQDIGAALGCGAHLSALRRTAVAGWTINDAINLVALQAMEDTALIARLLPVDAMLAELHTVQIDAEQAVLFSNGGRVRCEMIGFERKPDARVRVCYAEKFLGVADLKNGVLHPVRLVSRTN
jgi:tRNA pseudouridine55 synthase